VTHQIRQSYKSILRKKDKLFKPPCSERGLLERSIMMHGFLSVLLSTLGKAFLMDTIVITNGIIYILWLLANKFHQLEAFMEKYFVLQFDFRKRRTNVISIIGHGFSHMTHTHLASNMAALTMFSPLAISTLGHLGFIQLYSGGLVFSTLASCIWPTVSEHLGVDESNVECSVGASGAISAVITFVCLMYRDHSTTIYTPDWLKIFLHREDMNVPLGLAGLLWLITDLFGLFRLTEYFEETSDEEKKNIGYSSHIGGSIFGILFYCLHSSLQRHGAFLRAVVSAVSIPFTFIMAQLVTFYLFIFTLQIELQRRQLKRHRRR